ncbi:MAG: YhfC family glutamic-type intramembrane protease [Conexivisphaerales archaeon]
MIQNIDPAFFITPLVVMAFSFAPIIYLNRRGRLNIRVVLYALVAYFSAIAMKTILQYFTVGLVQSTGNLVAIGVYYGLQTSLFEVGIAYLIVRMAKGSMKAEDGVGYGLSLAMWENGVLISIPLLLDYVLYYATVPGSPQLYHALLSYAPSLFLPLASALPLIGFAVIERVSSLLLHLSWGYLAVLAVFTGRKRYLGYAMAMGFVDFLVPFEPAIGIAAFEGLVFTIAAISVVITFLAIPRTHVAESPGGGGFNLKQLAYNTFIRSVRYGKMYLVISVALPILMAAEFAFVPNRSGVNLFTLYLLILPLFIVIGSMSGLMIFTSDKRKGVYEYLMAYGADASTIFYSILIATLGLAMIVLVASLAIMATIFLITGTSISLEMIEELLLYTLPLSFSAPVFMTMSGMIWSALSTQVTGVNSPVGIAPMLGVVPVIVVFVISAITGPAKSIYVAGIVSVLIIAITVMTGLIADRKLVRERFLSNE